MQDNSPIHKARIVTQWFEEQQNITLLHWPSKGCDLNPIENVWGNIVRNRLCHMQDVNRRLSELIQKLVESVPQRIQECVDKERGWINTT